MKKIILFYAAYGGGHLSAANSIKQYLETNYTDIEITMIDCVKYINRALEKITTLAYKEMAKKAPWAWGHVYYHSQKGPLARISTSSNKLMALKLLRLFNEIHPDLVISTHPFGSQMTSYLKKRGKINCNLATIMTDFAPHNQWLIGKEYVDHFFVAHNGMKTALVKYGIPAEKISATGIPLSNRFLMHFNKQEIMQQFHLSPNKKVILFFGGGEFGLGKNKTLQLLQDFIDYAPNAQIVAIAGKNEKMQAHFGQVKQNCNRPEDIHVYGFSNQVPELMSISNLVVTKPGGLTTTESLASGVPLFLINPIPGQEEENAAFLEKAGVAIWLKKHDASKQAITFLFTSDDNLHHMKIKAKLLAKKNSTRDICRILMQ